ncbi:MAG TPA: hypothetical protein PKU82_11300 [Bacteroidia bacterium]|nr:hypothetical protein [Bacteroidia bacterium]
MHKQLRIISSRRLSVCPFSRSFFPPSVPISPLAFSRHARRLPVHYHPLPGVAVYHMPCGGWLWCFPSGRRQLSALPF